MLAYPPRPTQNAEKVADPGVHVTAGAIQLPATCVKCRAAVPDLLTA